MRGSDWGKYVPAEDHERMMELKNMGPHLLDEDGETIKDSDGSPKKITGIKMVTEELLHTKL